MAKKQYVLFIRRDPMLTGYIGTFPDVPGLSVSAMKLADMIQTAGFNLRNWVAEVRPQGAPWQLQGLYEAGMVPVDLAGVWWIDLED